VSLVINYDLPTNRENYIHRSTTALKAHLFCSVLCLLLVFRHDV